MPDSTMRVVVVPEPITVGVPENPVRVHINHLVGTHSPIGGWAAGSTKAAEDTNSTPFVISYSSGWLSSGSRS